MSALLFFNARIKFKFARLQPKFKVNKESQQHNFEEVLKKMMQYCSYSERSDFEVQIKLATFLISADDKRKVIAFLKEENFLNENRFAAAFVSGKVRIKRWGRYKISAALRAKRVDQSLIQEAFKEIDEEVYFDNIKHLLKLKKFSASMSDYEKSKIVRYLLSKGYENDLIWEAIKDFNKE
tara:strand:- start:21720 stop:22262 length:543 start_codon:yes stop_codon:yes gene_type:complete